jgi:hypothetical protein
LKIIDNYPERSKVNTSKLNEADRLMRYSRLSLWTALVLVLLMGATAAAAIGFPASPAGAFFANLGVAYPIMIAIAAAALKTSAKGARTDPSSPGMKALLNDELRTASMNYAYRNSFFSVIAVQPLLVIAPTWLAVARPVSVMACLTLTTGAVVMLASVLYYDR